MFRSQKIVRRAGVTSARLSAGVTRSVSVSVLLGAALLTGCGAAGNEALEEAAAENSWETEQAALVVSCGDNVAFNKPVTSSGYWSTGTPDKAVDGNDGTTWQTDLSTGAWLQVDLGAARSISRARVIWGWDTNYGDSSDSLLEGSLDGTSWVPMKTVTHTDADNRTPQDVTFPAVSARYVRFRATRWNGGWGHLNEIQLYENLARNKPATSSGYWSTGTPDKAVDGNDGTTWQTDLSTGAWLRVDLGTPHDISRARVVWGWDTNYGDSSDSVLEGSLDGTSWLLMKTVTHTDADNRTPQDVSFPAVSARYVRFRATQWNGGWGHLNEIQLYGQGVCTAAAATATYDATLQVPRCSGSFSTCDSGSLLTGRAGLGPEANASNTLYGSCADGTNGTFHSDESLDRLVVSSVDGGPLTAGKLVKVSATVWVWSAANDFLDLYTTSTAQQPSWQLLGTMNPVASGQQTLEATYVLPAGGLQAVRGQFRYTGSATPCSTGVFDDHDDLALGLECPTWYADTDGDGFGDLSTQYVSCTVPAGHVSNGRDNCPSTANADQADVDGDRVGDVCVAPRDCGDLAESNLMLRWTSWASDNATTTLSALTGSQVYRGSKGLRAVTQAAFDFAVRFTAPGSSVMDVSGYEQLRFAVRGLNTTPVGWQGNFPVVVLQDAAGLRRTYTPNQQLLTKDGTTWTAITLPLAGNSTWSVSGSAVDLHNLRQVEVHADTWDSGFTLDVDGMSFEHPQTVCP
ncbi:discoidin domain-containing protein [Hyalangium versicolor]|uniref:discoidin domain-containing protein n=1 Tax=Hyalangium versicolor TaxID=2861190 RepID=UPI001CCF8173|nr:discoidin domain-containing protein [Hyalangium versicolor]